MLGMVPVMEFKATFRNMSDVIPPIFEGMEPEIEFCVRSKITTEDNEPISEGIVPVMELYLSINDVSAVIRPTVLGIDPLIVPLLISNFFTLIRLPISEGIVPETPM